MKKTIIYIIMTLLLLSIATATLTNNTLLYYSMDNEDMSSYPSSDNYDTLDISPNAYDGYTRNFDNDQTGIRQEAIKGILEGASTFGRIEVNNNTYNSNLSGTSSFGVSLWYKPTDYANTLPHVLLSNSDAGNNRIALFYKEGEIRSTIYDGSFYFGNSSNNLPINNWYHIVMNSEGGQSASIYVNGELALNSHVSQHNSGVASFSIGNSFDGGTFSDQINGTLDEVFIRNNPFTEEEITLLYRDGNGINPFKEVLYGIDHNITYYTNDVSYFYQFNNETNEGYETDNITSFTNNSACYSEYCFNGTDTLSKTVNTLDKLQNFSGMYWFKGQINDSDLGVDGIDLEHIYQSGGGGITENLKFGLTNDGNISLVMTGNTANVDIDTGIRAGVERWQHIAFSYDGNRLLIWHNATIVSNTSENMPFTTGTTSNTSYVNLDSNEGLIDDFVLLDKAIDTRDVQQFMYYTEYNIEKEIFPVLAPVNITIYAVCDEIITLGTNISENRTFNWSEAQDLQYLTVTYSVRAGNLYLINETLETDFDYTFTSPPFIHNEYTSEVSACNPYECSSDSCTFNVCINSYLAEYGVCSGNQQLKTYTDSNNCPILYNIPSDNNTYIDCVNPDLEAEIEAKEENLLLIIVIVLIVLFSLVQIINISRILSFAGAILNIVFITLLFTQVTGNFILLPIGLLVMQVGLLFFLISHAKE